MAALRDSYPGRIATNRYETRLSWTGSTGLGWDHYDRTHSVVAPPAEQEIRVTTGESKGDPAILNPEQLLLMAARWRNHSIWHDEAVALMPMDVEPVRVTEISLRPRIAVVGDPSEERIHKLVHTAHAHCFVANSLNSAMSIEPTVERR